MCLVKIQIDDQPFELFLDKSSIEKRIRLIGTQLNVDYENKVPVFIGVLNGAFMFIADLMKEVTISCELTFIKIASYHGNTHQGQLVEDLAITRDIANRDVVIIEDIVDTAALH